MAAKNRPYEQFGTFILFKKLDTDSLGELWRAARLDGSTLSPMLALRRMSGGHRTAMTQSASEASQLVPLLSGTTFAKDQTIGVIDGIPFVAHEYSGGRSLRHIVDRARGDAGTTPNPVPLDQAIVIAEKIALSLATTADLRYLGSRLNHGALIPQFVWITDEGEIRVAGQQLGKGIVASMSDSKVAAERVHADGPRRPHVFGTAASRRSPHDSREVVGDRSECALRIDRRHEAGAFRARPRRQLLGIDVQPGLLSQQPAQEGARRRAA
jgi:hypothetical protein